MKRIILFTLVSCMSFGSMAQKGTNYGKTMKTKKVLSISQLSETMDTAAAWTGVVTGTVKQVCKREGCWLRLDDGSADGIMVQMKDHEFTVPKDIDGRTVYVSGTVTKTTTSVKMLKHYAEDAGKTKEEIDAITEPQTAIKMQAVGVKVI
jgi:hypothetical protein